MEVSGQLHTPVTLPCGEMGPDIHWIVGRLGPRAGLDTMEEGKIFNLLGQESNPGLQALSP
jgi:hypothetical protein